MSWPGTRAKINGGSITSMTKRGNVIFLPGVTPAQDSEDWIQLGHRQYRLRPGSFAERVLDWVTVAVDGE